jgi:hypothetical protein
MRHQSTSKDVGGGRDQEASFHTPHRVPTAHEGNQRTLARDRIRDTCGALNGDARNILNKKRQDSTPMHGYNPRRGGRYDNLEDKSPWPKPPGTRVFGRTIRAASIPWRFCQPTTVSKYSRETDPRVWLNDYHLACQLGGTTDDAMVIRNLALHLADSARTWLEHLPVNQIDDWDDLVRTSMGNFQGTYVPLRNSWDLRGCSQKACESLRNLILCFSKRCTELSSVGESEAVHAFLEGMTRRDLMRELGRNPPTSVNEIFDIATSYASGEEAVGPIFNGKRASGPRRRPRSAASPKSR